MNPYFTKMLEAKKNGTETFEYNGKTYVRHTLKSGLITYKKK